MSKKVSTVCKKFEEDLIGEWIYMYIWIYICSVTYIIAHSSPSYLLKYLWRVNTTFQLVKWWLQVPRFHCEVIYAWNGFVSLISCVLQIIAHPVLLPNTNGARGLLIQPIQFWFHLLKSDHSSYVVTENVSKLPDFLNEAEIWQLFAHHVLFTCWLDKRRGWKAQIVIKPQLLCLE